MSEGLEQSAPVANVDFLSNLAGLCWASLGSPLPFQPCGGQVGVRILDKLSQLVWVRKLSFFQMCQLEADLRNNLRTTPLGSSWGPKPYSTSLVSNEVQVEWYASGLHMGHSGWVSTSCGLLSGGWPDPQPATHTAFAHGIPGTLMDGSKCRCQWEAGGVTMTKHEWGFIDILSCPPHLPCGFVVETSTE